MKKLRHRRVKHLALGHTADRQECLVGTLGDPTGCRPPHPLSLAIHLQSPCCGIKSEFLRTKRVHLMAAGLRGQGLAMECPPRLWLREHDLTDRPTPISCQLGSCSWAKLRDRSHTGLFVLGGNPSAPTAHLKGLLSQHRGTSLGPGPAGKLGMLAALWPPCQLGIQNPLRNWPLQSAYGGWSPDCKGKCNPERTGVLCESRARQPPTQNNCPGWIQVSLAPSSSSLETPASPQKAMEGEGEIPSLLSG